MVGRLVHQLAVDELRFLPWRRDPRVLLHRQRARFRASRALNRSAVMPSACDLLLTNATVLTMDARFTVHRSGAVAIAGDSIAAVGPAAHTYDAATTIDCGGRVVMPGLVNAHTHVAMA